MGILGRLTAVYKRLLYYSGAFSARQMYRLNLDLRTAR